MATKLVRGEGKLLKEGRYVCNTDFEITSEGSRPRGQTNITGYLIGFDPKPLLGRAGETFVLRLSDGGEQSILLLEDVQRKPRWRFRLTYPINPKLDPNRHGR